ncbi:MAG: hypothetical protein ACPGLV_04050 [Bacteroidia bacterium]
MALKYILITAMGCLLFFSGCWFSKNKTNTNKAPTESITTTRFIVSFYSPGDGINRTAKNKFESFITNYETKITYTDTKWGREGETDYCLDLNELSESQQKAFISEVKTLLKNAKKVNFYENTTCRNSR